MAFETIVGGVVMEEVSSSIQTLGGYTTWPLRDAVFLFMLILSLVFSIGGFVSFVRNMKEGLKTLTEEMSQVKEELSGIKQKVGIIEGFIEGFLEGSAAIEKLKKLKE